MDWKLFKEVLPEDGQKITVLNPIDESEMQRTFYLDFWKKYNRSLYCNRYCQKWKPR